jgi:tetratricopeptide (TPR) repeat protein
MLCSRLLRWFLIGSLCTVPVNARSPSFQDSLAAGVDQLRAGDYFRAVLILNEAAAQLNQPGDRTTLARVHAYRAMAYIGLGQPERARAAVAQALTADPAIVVGAGDYSPALVALFEASRRPTVTDPESAGRDAERAGRVEDAFVAYLSAFHALPDPPSPSDEQRLRERIIALAGRLATPPAIPLEARDHVTKADRLLDAEAILGATAGVSSQAAAVELRRAVRIAPWWGEAMFKLATVAQRLQRVDEALLNLNLYRLADPVGYADAVARTRPAAPSEPAARTTVPRSLGPALIYIYWPEQQRGGGRQKVSCNGEQVAELRNNRFLVLRAPAGTHNLVFRDKQVSAVVENGREYHYRASIEGHWRFAMGPEIRLVAADAAKDEMRKQNVTVNDARRTRRSECTVAPPGRGRRE